MPVAIVFIVLAIIGFILLVLSMISLEEGKLQYPAWMVSLFGIVLLLGFWLIVSHQGLAKMEDGLYPVTPIIDKDGQVKPIIVIDNEIVNVVEKTKCNVPIDSQISVSHYIDSWGLNWMKDREYKIVNKKVNQ